MMQNRFLTIHAVSVTVMILTERREGFAEDERAIAGASPPVGGILRLIFGGNSRRKACADMWGAWGRG